jgi:ATP-dependent DNA ligase
LRIIAKGCNSPAGNVHDTARIALVVRDIQLPMPARRGASRKPEQKITAGAVPADELKAAFPRIKLPVRPPLAPMEVKSVREIPTGTEWLYEPKWDGFRCVAFRAGEQVLLQSKSGQPLGRYFPELVDALSALAANKFVVDGEIVILCYGHLSFDDLLLRIHPAASRVRKLAAEKPCTYLLFDILVNADGQRTTELPLKQRREELRRFCRGVPPEGSVRLSPATTDHKTAERWMRELGASGFDGVVAKCLDESYLSGERAMQKIKRLRTADCVVGGFR